MQFFTAYLKQRKIIILAFVLFFLVFAISFLMFHLPIEAVFYPSLVCALIGIIIIGIDYYKAYEKHKQLEKMQKLSDILIGSFPEATSIEDDDYRKIIDLLCEEQKQLSNHMTARYTDMVDYYTVWAHQIKTPIASIRLTLQNEDSALSRKLSSDLFRIEQYVEMVLMFIRLDSDTTDYMIHEYDLDTIVKQTVKKFSGEFISRKLRLEYKPLNTIVITDEKWLCFVIEQILSNALKYTPNGSITIRLEEPKTLCICDTGIGIAPEDLPRIFEKGYTGYNGRSNKKASGIGLYLCKRICNNLGHTIKASSSLDHGTTIRINLAQTKLEFE